MKSNSVLIQRVNKPDYYSLLYRNNEVLRLDKKEKTVTIDHCGWITRSTVDAINVGLSEIDCFNIEAKHKPSLTEIHIQTKDTNDRITLLDNEYECVIIDHNLLL